MKPQKVIKLCKIVSLVFVIVSIIELILIAAFASTEINIDGDKMTISELLMNPDMTPTEGPLLWFLFISTMVFYLVIGIVLFLTTLKPNLEQLSNAKRVVMLGMDLLVLTFIRLAYMTFLEKTPIDINGDPVVLKSIIFWQSVTPISAAYIWLVFTAVACGYLIIGLIVSAFGLKITIETEQAIAEARERKAKIENKENS